MEVNIEELRSEFVKALVDSFLDGRTLATALAADGFDLAEVADVNRGRLDVATAAVQLAIGQQRWQHLLRAALKAAPESVPLRDIAVAFGMPVQHSSTEKPGPLWDVRRRGSPFPGLRPMTEKDAAIFFGRGPEIEILAKKLEASPFVIVVGASGSGKSSLVWAGLLPKLQQAATGSVWVRMTPGEAKQNPVRALAEALAEALRLRASYVEQHLANPQLLTMRLDDHGPEAQLILFVDQFEELFTLVANTEAELRTAFIDHLARLMQTERVRVVATMQAAFQGPCMDSAEFGETLAKWFNDGFMALPHPGERALNEMIEGPSKVSGIEFEPALIDRIVRDTGPQPGNLALMAFALNELYGAQGPDQQLTMRAYDDIGGVAGAVARRAELKFEELTSELQDGADSAFEEVFRHLVEMDESSGLAARGRVPLSAMSGSAAAMNLITSFVEARLLVISEERADPSAGARHNPLVEVGHEALFRSWPRLRDWIEARKDHLRLRRQLQREAAYWDSQGRPPAYRWSDERALGAAKMIRELPYEPSAVEATFLGPVDRETMLHKLRDLAADHSERATIGIRLALLGDTRPGTGLVNNLPDIFWCPVPGGVVRLEDGGGEFRVAPFSIARYPVTYAQYRCFLDDPDGYRSRQWWAGLSGRYYEEPGRQIPLLDNHPTVNVDWMEAVAYTRWLSQRLEITARLPAEWEWQQAATNGKVGFEFPWGGRSDITRANTLENRLNQTVAVGLYPQGTAGDQALDLAGNIWEWCLNEYRRPVPTSEITFGGLETRAIRGGAASSSIRYARAAYRNHYRPDYRFDALGFRIVRIHQNDRRNGCRDDEPGQTL